MIFPSKLIMSYFWAGLMPGLSFNHFVKTQNLLITCFSHCQKQTKVSVICFSPGKMFCLPGKETSLFHSFFPDILLITSRVSGFLSAFLWDVFLQNEKDTDSFAQLPVSFAKAILKVFHNGQVLYGRNLISKARCQMYFESYPHDTQICELIFKSYAVKYPEFNFTKSAVSMKPTSMSSSNFDLISRNSFVNKTTSYGSLFSHFVFQLNIKRKVEYFVCQVSLKKLSTVATNIITPIHLHALFSMVCLACWPRFICQLLWWWWVHGWCSGWTSLLVNRLEQVFFVSMQE